MLWSRFTFDPWTMQVTHKHTHRRLAMKTLPLFFTYTGLNIPHLHFCGSLRNRFSFISWFLSRENPWSGPTQYLRLNQNRYPDALLCYRDPQFSPLCFAWAILAYELLICKTEQANFLSRIDLPMFLPNGFHSRVNGTAVVTCTSK